MVGDLALQGGLQNRLGQLLQQPALAGQLQPLATGLLDELVSFCSTVAASGDGSAWS
jgi:hypothetical protein